MLEEQPSKENSSERLVDSLLWGAALSGLIRIGQVIVSLVIIRLLTPEIYGQFGFLSAVLTFVYVLSMQRFMEFSFHQSDSDLNLGAQLSFGIMLHFGLFVFVNVVSVCLLFSDQYRIVTPYLSVASLGILLNVARMFHSVLLQREMNWRRIRTLHLLSFLFSSLVALFAAQNGYGLWALVVHSLLVPVPFVLDSLRRLSRIKLVPVAREFLPTIKFGLIRNVTGGVHAGQTLLESSLLTLLVGFASFGLYGRALALAQLLTGAATQPLTAILYPVLARDSQSKQSVANITGLLMRVALWIGVPMVFLIFLYPELLVLIAFGEEWLAVVPMLPLAGVLVLAQVLRQIITMVLTSQMLNKVVLIEALMLCGFTGLGIFLMQDDLMSYLIFMAIAVWVINLGLLGVLLKHGVVDLIDQVRMLAGLVCATILIWLWSSLVSYFGWLQLLPEYGAALVQVVVLLILMTLAIRIGDARALNRLLGYLPGATMWRHVFLY